MLNILKLPIYLNQLATIVNEHVKVIREFVQYSQIFSTKKRCWNCLDWATDAYVECYDH
jgi:hypothetical protein